VDRWFPNNTFGVHFTRYYKSSQHLASKYKCHIQGGSDKSGTLSKLHRHIKKFLFWKFLLPQTVSAVCRSINTNKKTHFRKDKSTGSYKSHDSRQALRRTYHERDAELAQGEPYGGVGRGDLASQLAWLQAFRLLRVKAKFRNKSDDLIPKMKEVMGSLARDTLAKAFMSFRSRIEALCTADGSFIEYVDCQYVSLLIVFYVNKSGWFSSVLCYLKERKKKSGFIAATLNNGHGRAGTLHNAIDNSEKLQNLHLRTNSHQLCIFGPVLYWLLTGKGNIS